MRLDRSMSQGPTIRSTSRQTGQLPRRDVLPKKALMGALALYLDFINLFVMLLQLTGARRD